MAKSIIWTEKAQDQKRQILNYWVKRNKSKTYSKKLIKIFKESVVQISKFPNLGKKTGFYNSRARVIKDDLIVYEEFENEIVVLAIWDTRRNPKKFPG